LQLF